jgi:4-hydroxybenzoate polyprenyltransferase
VAVLDTTAHPSRTLSGFVAHVLSVPLLLIREARGAVLLVYLLRSIAGVFTGQEAVTLGHIGTAALACGTMCLSVMFVYILNGLTDLDVDRLNGSTRPLATGALTPVQARRALYVLVAAVLLSAMLLPLGVTLCNVLMLLLGYVYSGGRTPAKLVGGLGLAVAAAGSVLPYVSTGLAAHGALSSVSLLTAILLGLWVWTLGATKDLSDVVGDVGAGRSTLPATVGIVRALRVLIWRTAVVTVLLTTLAAAGLASPALLAAPVCGVAVVGACLTLPRVPSSRRVARRPYRAFMASQYLMNGLLICVSFLP